MSQNPSKRASRWDGHTSRRAWLTRRSTSCGRRCASSPKMKRRGACFRRLCHNEQPIGGEVLERLAYTARPNDLQAPHERFAPQSEMDHFIARARVANGGGHMVPLLPRCGVEVELGAGCVKVDECAELFPYKLVVLYRQSLG